LPRGGSRRGRGRGGGLGREQQANGRSPADGSTPQPPSKARDLSNPVKPNKSASVVRGLSSVKAGKKGAAKRDSILTRVNSSSNTGTMPGQDAKPMSETGSKPGQSSSRKTNVDPGSGGTTEPQRRKSQLLWLKPVEEEDKTSSGSADNSEDEADDDPPSVMSEAEADKRIVEDIKEFFSVRNIDESEDYFTRLPPEHHHRLVNKMVSNAIESKEADGKLVADAFTRATEKKLCSISAFEEGFLPVAELLDDIVIDAPKAFQILATMMKGAGLDNDEERRTKIAQKSTDGDKLLELLA
jgi:translation initiation factor 4G